MQAFWFNTRRAKFADRQVRDALAHTFDFEWSNANLFYGQYTRTTSFFSNTELASSGLPEGQELEILEPYRDRLPAEVFTTAYEPQSNDGSGNIRRNLRTARKMLQEAGWVVRDGVLTHAETGETMEIEFSWSLRRSSASSARWSRTWSGSGSPRASGSSTRRSTRIASTSSTSTSWCRPSDSP